MEPSQEAQRPAGPAVSLLSNWYKQTAKWSHHGADPAEILRQEIWNVTSPGGHQSFSGESGITFLCTLQPTADDGGEDFEEVVVDLKGKAGRSRRSSSLGAGSALPHIQRVRSGGQLVGGQVGARSPLPGYNKQMYSERSSPVERHRSPSAGGPNNGRVDWKAKYLK